MTKWNVFVHKHPKLEEQLKPGNFLHPYTISMIINVVLCDSTSLPASKKIVITSEIMCITSTPPFSEIKSERKRQPLFVQT